MAAPVRRISNLSHVVSDVQVEVDTNDQLDEVLHQIKLLVDYRQVQGSGECGRGSEFGIRLAVFPQSQERKGEGGHWGGGTLRGDIEGGHWGGSTMVPPFGGDTGLDMYIHHFGSMQWYPLNYNA